MDGYVETALHTVASVETSLPEVHSMFKKALDDTEQHLEAIEAEYARCMSMYIN